MPPKQSSSIVKVYLLAYNTFCLVAWSYLLQKCLNHLRDPSAASFLDIIPDFWNRTAHDKLQARARTGFRTFGQQVKWIQTTAILEPIHVMLGFVRTNLGTTAAQVASRLFVLYGCLLVFPSIQYSAFFMSMVIAWCLAEMIRYATYITTLLGMKVAPLEYLRYTLFYVLYPVGAGSEATFISAAAPLAGAQYGKWAEYAYKFLALAGWPIALLGMMSHMHAQRKKHIGGFPKNGQKLGTKEGKKRR